MIYANDDEIVALVHAFENQTLPKNEWTHRAHLTVGLYYCRNHPKGVAKNLMSDGILWLNDAHGTPNTETSGYHETLTVFWLNSILVFLQTAMPHESLTSLANRLLATFDDTKLPLAHYSRELLFSPTARAVFVAPDLVAIAATDVLAVDR